MKPTTEDHAAGSRQAGYDPSSTKRRETFSDPRERSPMCCVKQLMRECKMPSLFDPTGFCQCVDKWGERRQQINAGNTRSDLLSRRLCQREAAAIALLPFFNLNNVVWVALYSSTAIPCSLLAVSKVKCTSRCVARGEPATQMKSQT